MRGDGEVPLDLSRPALEVAPDLLGWVLVRGARAGKIVEVEAYGADNDPASHAYRGPTARNGSMFGPCGRLYVYLIYGMHHCANVVCGPAGTGGAVLIRALEPLRGVEGMWSDRPRAKRQTDLCSGPGKLTAALSIDLSDDGVDLTVGPVFLEPPASSETDSIVRGPRVGISKAVERPWRFAFAGHPDVSPPRRSLTSWR